MKQVLFVTGLLVVSCFSSADNYFSIESSVESRSRAITNFEMAVIFARVLVEFEKDVYGGVQTNSLCGVDPDLCRKLEY